MYSVYKLKKLILYIFTLIFFTRYYIFPDQMVVLNGNFAVGCGPASTGLPLNTYTSMYARTNRRYNERGSRTNHVRSSIPHCIQMRFRHKTVHVIPGVVRRRPLMRETMSDRGPFRGKFGNATGFCRSTSVFRWSFHQRCTLPFVIVILSPEIQTMDSKVLSHCAIRN